MEGPLLKLSRARIFAIVLPIALDVIKLIRAIETAARRANLAAALTSRPLYATFGIVVAVGPPGGDAASGRAARTCAVGTALAGTVCIFLSVAFLLAIHTTVATAWDDRRGHAAVIDAGIPCAGVLVVAIKVPVARTSISTSNTLAVGIATARAIASAVVTFGNATACRKSVAFLTVNPLLDSVAAEGAIATARHVRRRTGPKVGPITRLLWTINNAVAATTCVGVLALA